MKVGSIHSAEFGGGKVTAGAPKRIPSFKSTRSSNNWPDNINSFKVTKPASSSGASAISSKQIPRRSTFPATTTSNASASHGIERAVSFSPTTRSPNGIGRILTGLTAEEKIPQWPASYAPNGQNTTPADTNIPRARSGSARTVDRTVEYTPKIARSSSDGGEKRAAQPAERGQRPAAAVNGLSGQEKERDGERQEVDVSRNVEGTCEALRYDLLRAKDVLMAREEARAEYSCLLAAKNDEVKALYTELVAAQSKNGNPPVAAQSTNESFLTPPVERVPFVERALARRAVGRAAPNLVSHTVRNHLQLAPQVLVDHSDQVTVSLRGAARPEPKFCGRVAELDLTQYIRLSSPKLARHHAASSPQYVYAQSAPSPCPSPSFSSSPQPRRRSAANSHFPHAVPHLLPCNPPIPAHRPHESQHLPCNELLNAPARRRHESPQLATRAEIPILAPAVPSSLWPSSFYLLSSPRHQTTRAVAARQQPALNGPTVPPDLADPLADTTRVSKPWPNATSGTLTAMWAFSRAGRKRVAHDVCDHIWGDGGSMASNARPPRAPDGADVGGGSVGSVPQLNMATRAKTRAKMDTRQEQWIGGVCIGNELEDRGMWVPLVVPSRGDVDFHVPPPVEHDTFRAVRQGREAPEGPPLRHGQEPLRNLDLPPQENPRFTAAAQRASRTADERQPARSTSTPTRTHEPDLASPEHRSSINSPFYTPPRSTNLAASTIDHTPCRTPSRSTRQVLPSVDEVQEHPRTPLWTIAPKHLPIPSLKAATSDLDLANSLSSGLDLGPLRGLSECLYRDSSLPAPNISPTTDAHKQLKSDQNALVDESHLIADQNSGNRSQMMASFVGQSVKTDGVFSDGNHRVPWPRAKEVTVPLGVRSTLGIQDDSTTLIGSGNRLPSGISTTPFAVSSGGDADTTPTFDQNRPPSVNRGDDRGALAHPTPQVIVVQTADMTDNRRSSRDSPTPTGSDLSKGRPPLNGTCSSSEARPVLMSRARSFSSSLRPSVASKNKGDADKHERGKLQRSFTEDSATLMTGQPASACPTIIPIGISIGDDNALLQQRFRSRLGDDIKDDSPRNKKGSLLSTRTVEVAGSPLSQQKVVGAAVDSMTSQPQFHSLPIHATDVTGNTLELLQAPDRKKNQFLDPGSAVGPIFATMGAAVRTPDHFPGGAFSSLNDVTRDWEAKERDQSNRGSKDKKTKYRKPRPAPLRDNNPRLRSIGNIFNHFTRPITTIPGAGGHLAGIRSKMTTPSGGRGQNVLRSRALASRGFATMNRKPTDAPRDRARTVISKSKPAVHHASLFFDTGSSAESDAAEDSPISVHSPSALARELDRSLQHAITTFKKFQSSRAKSSPRIGSPRCIHRRATLDNTMRQPRRTSSLDDSKNSEYDAARRTTKDADSLAQPYTSCATRRSSWTAGERLNTTTRIVSSELNKPLVTISSCDPSSAPEGESRTTKRETREVAPSSDEDTYTDSTGFSERYRVTTKDNLRETYVSFATPIKEDKSGPLTSPVSREHDPFADSLALSAMPSSSGFRVDSIALSSLAWPHNDSLSQLRSPRTSNIPEGDEEDDQHEAPDTIQLTRKGTKGTVETGLSANWITLAAASSLHRQHQVSIWVPTRVRSPEGSGVLLAPGAENALIMDKVAAVLSSMNDVVDASEGEAEDAEADRTMTDGRARDAEIPAPPSENKSRDGEMMGITVLQKTSTESSFLPDSPPFSPMTKISIQDNLDDMIDGLVVSRGCMVFARDMNTDSSGTYSPDPSTE